MDLVSRAILQKMAYVFQRINDLSPICWQIAFEEWRKLVRYGLYKLYHGHMAWLSPNSCLAFWLIFLSTGSFFDCTYQSTLNCASTLHHFSQLCTQLAHNSRRYVWFQIYSCMVFVPGNRPCKQLWSALLTTGLRFTSLLLGIRHGPFWSWPCSLNGLSSLLQFLH